MPNAVVNLLTGRRLAVAALSAVSLAAGLAEAAFLVAVSKASFALADGSASVSLGPVERMPIAGVIAVAAGLVALKLILSLLGNKLSARLIVGVTIEVRKQLAAAYLWTPWQVQQAEGAGSLHELLTNFANQSAAAINSVTSLVIAGMNIISIFFLAFFVDPIVASLVLVVGLSLSFLIRPLREAVKRQSRKSVALELDYGDVLAEMSSIGLEINAFAVQEEIRDKIDRIIDRNSREIEHLYLARGRIPVVYSGMAYVALLACVSVMAAMAGSDLAAVGAVILMMLRSLNYGQAVQTSLAGLAAARPFAETVQERLTSFRAKHRVDTGADAGPIELLQVQDAHYAYDGEEMALRGATLSVSRGQIVGLIGPSGAGKSTLVQIILRLRLPNEGAVLANGRPADEYGIRAWSRRVAFVPQSAAMLADSIAENIKFFRNASESAVFAAARLADIDDQIKAMPDGYMRVIGKDGVTLSGGQLQRLCIARALLGDPDVLILDEPTSALNAESELEIARTLVGLRSRTSIVLITHRPALLEICDEVYEVNNGRVTLRN